MSNLIELKVPDIGGHNNVDVIEVFIQPGQTVAIDDSLIVPADKGILEDLIAAAFNDARSKADSVANEEMGKAQQGMGLPPGFKLPF